MRNKKLFFGALLVTIPLLLSACSFGTAQSSNKKKSSSSSSSSQSGEVINEDIYRIYQLYAASGGTLTYDEWLNTIRGQNGQDGAPGKDGASILTGSGRPMATLGNVGDSYIDTTTWNFYSKTNNGWVLKGNIKGQDATGSNQNDQGLEFYLLDDGTYGVGFGSAIYLSDIVIPSSFNGRAVTQIVDYFGSTGIPGGFYASYTSVTIPTSITYIGTNAIGTWADEYQDFTVNYLGTCEEFNEITKDEWWFARDNLLEEDRFGETFFAFTDISFAIRDTLNDFCMRVSLGDGNYEFVKDEIELEYLKSYEVKFGFKSSKLDGSGIFVRAPLNSYNVGDNQIITLNGSYSYTINPVDVGETYIEVVSSQKTLRINVIVTTDLLAFDTSYFIFASYEYTYDGNSHIINPVQNVPEGATVYYVHFSEKNEFNQFLSYSIRYQLSYCTDFGRDYSHISYVSERGIHYYVACVYQEGYRPVFLTATLSVLCATHDFSSYETTKPATCTESGTRTRICYYCGYEETITISPLGHYWGETEVITEPTFESDGLGRHTCLDCGAVEEVVIPSTLPYEVQTATLEKKNEEVYLVLNGALRKTDNPDLNWAFGLQKVVTVGTSSYELYDWYYGSEIPDESDYNITAVITSEDSFSVSLNLTGLGLPAGMYNIHAGTKDYYSLIKVDVTDTTNNYTRDDMFNYYYRSDSQVGATLSICLDALPPVALTTAEAKVDENEQVWVKIGGLYRDQSITLDELQYLADNLTPFIQFQSANNNYYRPNNTDGLVYHFTAEEVNGKLYLYININITFMCTASNTTYNTHLNLLENTQMNCVMEGEFLNDPISIPGGKLLQIFSNPNGTYNEQLEVNNVNINTNAYGNLGFRVTTNPNA